MFRAAGTRSLFPPEHLPLNEHEIPQFPEPHHPPGLAGGRALSLGLANYFHRGVEGIHLVNMLMTSFSVSETVPPGNREAGLLGLGGLAGRSKEFQGPGLESWDVESLHLRRHLRDVAPWQNWHLHLRWGVVGVRGLHRLYALALHSCGRQIPSPFDRQTDRQTVKL